MIESTLVVMTPEVSGGVRMARGEAVKLEDYTLAHT